MFCSYEFRFIFPGFPLNEYEQLSSRTTRAFLADHPVWAYSATLIEGVTYGNFLSYFWIACCRFFSTNLSVFCAKTHFGGRFSKQFSLIEGSSLFFFGFVSGSSLISFWFILRASKKHGGSSEAPRFLSPEAHRWVPRSFLGGSSPFSFSS